MTPEIEQMLIDLDISAREFAELSRAITDYARLEYENGWEDAMVRHHETLDRLRRIAEGVRNG